MGNKGKTCSCKESMKGRVSARLWRIYAYKCNYSAFNGYKHTASDYSGVVCARCGVVWRTKSAYIHRDVPIMSEAEREAWLRGTLLQLLEGGAEAEAQASPKREAAPNYESPNSFVAVKKGQKPCGECPYLRTAAPGYFGGNREEVYAEPITKDALLPCHKVQHTPQQHVCVGLLITRTNSFKMGINPVLRRDEATVKQLPPDVKKRCFSRRLEFEQHHAGGFKVKEREYFITFGTKHKHRIGAFTFDWRGYCTITAKDEAEAREWAMYLFSDQWAFSYNDKAQLAAFFAGEQGRFSVATLKEANETEEGGPAGHGYI